MHWKCVACSVDKASTGKNCKISPGIVHDIITAAINSSAQLTSGTESIHCVLHQTVCLPRLKNPVCDQRFHSPRLDAGK